MHGVSTYMMNTASLSTWSKVGYAVGVIGLVITLLRELRERRERRRVRPVVIAHEEQQRTIKDRNFVASVFLTNESAASAFNIRFGIVIGDVEVGWRHDPADAEPSRINVLPPGGRWPDGSSVVDVVIPDGVVFSTNGDPDQGRRYWATYQSPSGEWWHTTNPVGRGEDLMVKRLRSRRWSAMVQKRRFRQRSGKGAQRIAATQRELNQALLEDTGKDDEDEGS